MNFYEEMITDAKRADLERFIDEKKTYILNEVKDENAKGSIFQFVQDMQVYQNLVSLHLTLFVDSGGAHAIRYDFVFYYDLEMKKEKKLLDFVDASILEILPSLSTKELLEKHFDKIYLDEKLMYEGLKPTLVNYQNMLFSLDGVYILFPPYQVGPWSSGEIRIFFPYEMIAQYLKI